MGVTFGTALQLASFLGDLELVQFLIEDQRAKVDLNVRGREVGHLTITIV